MKNNRRKQTRSFDVRLTSINHKINRKAMIFADAQNLAQISSADWQLAQMNRFYLETVYTPVGKTVSRYPENAEVPEAVEKIFYTF